ncbi:hypothetical protein QN277_014690 [Acacia crassicarpa]|uniref:BFN domain-containing protein n=1 Tax=Acacia crassicarpa TaxID=499986 RepID=A0AAE1JWP8_9FABA|nr:hypothetical protein QN277_014690 [Acacia crassicarpa]
MCPSVRAELAGFCSLPMIGPVKATYMRSEFWGCKEFSRGKGKANILFRKINARKCKAVQCNFNLSSNGSGSMSGNLNEQDEDYVNSSVIDAVEVKSGTDGFMIKMRDGRHLRCIHNNPQGGHLPGYAPYPAIVLKMEDITGLLLPIIVSEMPSVFLMAAVRNVQIVCFYFQGQFHYFSFRSDLSLVRVTRRVYEAYFAQLYLTKVANENECISFDLRPSDAINIAARCKVPIQVNKYLAYSDGMRVTESGKLLAESHGSDGELDRPSGQPCAETQEFNLLRNMLKAVVQERYKDAGMTPSMP